MKHYKRVVAAVMAVAMLFGICEAIRIPDKAQAANGNVFYTTEDFRKDFAKVLLSQVGKGYTDGGGYSVESGGTPKNPAKIKSSSFDCYGLVITSLMAMGYDYFEDSSGKKWELNGSNGANVFRSKNGIFYAHATGDKIILHNKTDADYNLTLRFGKIIDLTKQDELPTGTLIFSLPKNSECSSVTLGNFSKNVIGGSDDYYLAHCSVALFSMKKKDSITPQNYHDVSDADRKAALAATWTDAVAMIKSMFGVDYATLVTGASKRSTQTNGYFVPYLWDARGRGYREASATDYKSGFKDGHAFKHFGTAYSTIWQIESLNNDVGVSVDNNPYGKTVTMSQAVTLEILDSYGDVSINKSDVTTTAMISGATFTLYEWSQSANKYVVSPTYQIKESGTTGKYYTYSGNARALILVTSDNLGRIRVEETSPPKGYSNIDPATGKIYTWEHTFRKDGDTEVFTIDAKNTGVQVGFNVVKKGTDGPFLAGAEFTLYSNEACTTVAKDLNNKSVFTSGSDGKANIQFRLTSNAQTYYLKETKAPTGYRLSADVYRITVTKANDGSIALAVKTGGTGAFSAVTEITAENAKILTKGELPVSNTPQTGNLTITKQSDIPVEEKMTFWFYIYRSGYESWKSITLQPGQSTGSVTISGLRIGEYTVLEVEKNGDTQSVSASKAVPYTATGEGKVTVVVDKNVTKTIQNLLTKVRVKKTAK